jgi:hypothetical protein
MVRILGWLGLLTVAVATPALADGASLYFIDTGPLRLRDTFILNSGFLIMEPDTPTPVTDGRWRLDVFHTKSNSFAKSNTVEETLKARPVREPVTVEQLRSIDPDGALLYLDGELDITKISLDYQVNAAWQFGVLLQRLEFHGGVLDDSIEDFHDNFGFGQAGRTGVPKNQFNAYLRSRNGEYYIDQAPSSQLGDVVLNAKYSHPVNGSNLNGWVWGVKTAIKLPMNDAGLLSSGETDVGVQFLLARNNARSCFHADVSVTYLGEHTAYAVLAQTVVSVTAAYEWGLSPVSSVVGQLTVSQSPLRSLNIPELAETNTQISLGYKRQVAAHTALFAAFTENIAHFDNTADIGFHLGISRTL